MYERFEWFVEFSSNWYLHVVTYVTFMLETERSIVTEIYCRKHQLTPLATLETFLSETLLLHGDGNFRFLDHFCQNFACESWRNIAAKYTGNSKKRTTKNKCVSPAVKMERTLTFSIRVWGSCLDLYIQKKKSHKKEIQWGEEEREKSLTWGFCLDGSPISQKQHWKECMEISNENLYFWKTIFTVDWITEMD